MFTRDYKRFPRKGVYGSGGGIRQWDRFDFFATLCVPLALISLWMFVGRYREGRKMRAWVEVPAHVENLATHHMASRHGDIPRIACQYSYDYSGKTYYGRRVSILCDKDDPWDDDWYERLKSALATGHSLPCYVNAADPSEAVLKRDMDWMELSGPGAMFLLCTAYATGLYLYRRHTA